MFRHEVCDICILKDQKKIVCIVIIHMCVYKTYTYTPHLYKDKPIGQNVNY